MLLALGYLGAPAAELRAFRQDPPPAGLCAGLAATLVDPEGLDDDLDAVLAPVPKPVVKGLPFADGAVLQLRTRILAEATVRRGDLDRHVALLDRLPEELRPEARGWTVLVAVGRRDPLDPLDPDELPERSRAVLRELAATLETGRRPDLYQAFWRAGLFAYVGANERALGLTAPGPLDRRAGGHPLWWWLHGVRCGRVPLDRWVALVREDPLPVLEDAAMAPFELYRDRFRPGGYDVEPLIDAIVATAAAHGVDSPTLQERLATLRKHAANPSVVHGKVGPRWP
jgi:hypothetical protein